MSSDTNALSPASPIPAFDDPGRVARAASYMARMAEAANSGLLARPTLDRLRSGSDVVRGMGLPDLVLRKGPDEVWHVHDQGVNTGSVNSPDVNTDPVNTEGPVNTAVNRSEAGADSPDWRSGSDRKAYMREYMAKRRAKERGE